MLCNSQVAKRILREGSMIFSHDFMSGLHRELAPPLKKGEVSVRLTSLYLQAGIRLFCK